MSDSDRLLERIEEGVVAHGGDLGGWKSLMAAGPCMTSSHEVLINLVGWALPTG